MTLHRHVVLVLVPAVVCAGCASEKTAPAPRPAIITSEGFNAAPARTTAPTPPPAPATAPAPPPAPATAPTPYTADQIREANPPGTRLVFRLESAGQPTVYRVYKFVGGDAVHAVLESSKLSEQGEPTGDVERSEPTWVELRDHAAFPTAATQRVLSTATVPAGEFDVWLYTVNTQEHGQPVITRFSFALDRPGPPVLLEQELDGDVVLRMALVEDSRGH